ncbi:MAG: PrsW family intramembrane metalloprotease [Leptospirales bacterium]|nr:PrsW family intramembrane metalloprotease [Leptospirales bacterium]
MSPRLARPTPAFLFVVFSAIFLAFFVAGAAISRFDRNPSMDHAVDALKGGRIAAGEAELLALIEQDPEDEQLWYILLASLAANPHPFPDVFKHDPTGRFPQALNFAVQIMTGKSVSVPASYPLVADVGGILMMANQDLKAIEYLQEAEKLHPDFRTRWRILRTLKDLGWKDDFAKLMDDPLYYASADDLMRADFHLHVNQVLPMIQYVLSHQFYSYQTALVGAATVIGLCWLIVMLHIGRWKGWPVSTRFGVPVAVFLGILSAYATLCAVEIESKFFTLTSGHTWQATLLYAIFGIGLREEILKLLLIAPLLIIFRKAAPIQILMLATLGGLGFAIEENNQYYVEGGSSVVSRFLTANFAHMSMTGLAGYAFVTALNDVRQWGNFFERFAYVILIHGFYDFLLMDTTFANLSFFASFVFILVARKHLRLVADLAGLSGYSVAPILIFVMALAISMGTSYLLFALELGPMRGVVATLLSTASMMFVGILFFQEFSREA